MLGGALGRYRGSGNRHLEKIVARMERDIPGLFTFLEHPEAEPADNSSERACAIPWYSARQTGRSGAAPGP